MSERLTALMIACSLLAGGQAYAQDAQEQAPQPEPDPIYDVELVLFRFARPILSSEQWAPQTLPPRITGAVDFARPVVGDPAVVDFKRLQTNALGKQLERLQRAGAYDVLLHMSWRQPGYTEAGARAVRINLGKLAESYPEFRASRYILEARSRQYGDTVPIEPEIPDPSGEALSADGAELVESGVTHTLDGTITLVRSRYLHVYTDLIYTIPSADVEKIIEKQAVTYQEPIAPELETIYTPAVDTDPVYIRTQIEYVPIPAMQSFPFRYHRRMRSGELHYIDHPLMGMLILVTPVEEESNALSS